MSDDQSETDEFLRDLEAPTWGTTNAKENILLSVAEKKQSKKEEAEQKRYLKTLEKQKLKDMKEEEKRTAQLTKFQKAEVIKDAIRSSQDDDCDSVFSEKGSKIIGLETRQLLVKVREYKELFKTELKAFKIKKNASVSELKAAIEEMDSIISTSNCDKFLLDGIIQSIRMVEGVSAMTRNYNVTGMADLLKGNIHFNQLCRQLFLKYNLFSATPIEYQMVFIIATTAYICKNKNSNKKEVDKYLNEPIPIPPEMRI